MKKRDIGKYAKSCINTNGEKLIEFCTIQNLRITNTFFNIPKHMAVHIRLTRKRKLLEKICTETKSTTSWYETTTTTTQE